VEPWAQNRDAKIGQEGMPEVEGVCSLVLKQEGAELQQPIDGPLIEVLVRHIHSDGLLDSAGHDIYERLKIKRLGDNARERGSPAPRAFTELGLSQISRVAGEHDHWGSSIALIQPGCRTPGLAVPCWIRSVQYDHVGLQTGHRCLDGGEMHVEQSRNNQAFVYKGFNRPRTLPVP
jgi:hypothetical protein